MTVSVCNMAKSKSETMAFKATDEVFDAVEEYANEHDITKAEALRQACNSYFLGWRSQQLTSEMKRIGTYAAAVLIGVQLGTPVNVEHWIIAFLLTVLGVVGYEQAQVNAERFLPERVRTWVVRQ